MPLRALLRFLVNNEQLVQKIADSYPIRRAAQLTAYFFHKGQEMGQEGLEKLKESEMRHKLEEEAKNTGKKASAFKDTFLKELQEGWKEVNEEMKKKR